MPRRSRGCQACRQRRIGCDGTLPSCRQCLLTNRTCSGPVQGTIIINQTEEVTSRYSRRSQTQSIFTVFSRPTLTPIFSQAFISEFLLFLTSTPDTPARPTWLRLLGDIPGDEKGSSLDLSLQALATAYCGVAAKNHSAVMEACRIYGEALSQHSKDISQRSKVPMTVIIYTSVVLSLFEAVWPTNLAAYAIHLNAARKMLAMADNDLAQNKLLRKVAVHVQYQALFMMIASPLGDEPIESETELWTDASRYPSEEIEGVSDKLMVQLFSLGKFFSANTFNAGDASLHLDSISSTIDGIWSEYMSEAILRNEIMHNNSEGETMYRDGATAMNIAYYAASQMVLLLAQSLVIVSTHPMQRIEEHAQVILNCASFLYRMRKYIGCACFAMFLPVTLVALCSPSCEHKHTARLFLTNQIQDTEFTGLRSIAVRRIDALSPCVMRRIKVIGRIHSYSS
ncbi:hypothetical protein F5884DRAFT_151676 [Xylogone sp. PMI_703]|nr:hypothetical protein F5884DRAFT_151676 [Xylogone sp. PMI_703]